MNEPQTRCVQEFVEAFVFHALKGDQPGSTPMEQINTNGGFVQVAHLR